MMPYGYCDSPADLAKRFHEPDPRWAETVTRMMHQRITGTSKHGPGQGWADYLELAGVREATRGEG